MMSKQHVIFSVWFDFGKNSAVRGRNLYPSPDFKVSYIMSYNTVHIVKI